MRKNDDNYERVVDTNWGKTKEGQEGFGGETLGMDDNYV